VLYYSLIWSQKLHLKLLAPCFNLRFLLWSLVTVKVVQLENLPAYIKFSLPVTILRSRDLDTPLWFMLCLLWASLSLWSASGQCGQLHDVSCLSRKGSSGVILPSGHKLLTFCQNSKCTRPLSIPPEVFVCFDSDGKLN
jgi:hypothetical protein